MRISTSSEHWFELGYTCIHVSQEVKTLLCDYLPLTGNVRPTPEDLKFGSPVEVTDAGRQRWKYTVTWEVFISELKC